jgi:hypothetical protein
MIIRWEGGRLNKTKLVKSNLQTSKPATALCSLASQSPLFFQMQLHKVFLENGGTGVAQYSHKPQVGQLRNWGYIPSMDKRCFSLLCSD